MAGARIMIVDDEAAMRGTLRHLLTEAGHTVVGEAGDGVEALEEVERCRPDLVTMDIAMPRMGGIEATRALRAAHPELPVIMISSLDEASLTRAATAVGAAAFLRKPPEAATLIAAAARALAAPTA